MKERRGKVGSSEMKREIEETRESGRQNAITWKKRYFGEGLAKVELTMKAGYETVGIRIEQRP